MVALAKNNTELLVRRKPADFTAGSQADSGLVPGEREVNTASPLPFLGLGMGLRPQHYHQILTQKPKIDWFEIISENFIFGPPRANEILEEILDNYPVVMHGVAMYPGNAQGLDFNYLNQLKTLIRKINPPWISDHLCWGSVDGRFSHDLLPLPYTEETIALTAENLRIAQDYLETPLILENVSSYASFEESRMSEWDFLGEITDRAGTGILLDVNNVYVSARNHGFDPREYLDSIDLSRVHQVHLAGHSDHGSYVLDTHDGPVIPAVWELYDYLMQKSGPRSTMIEWDADIPEFQVVYDEIQQARNFWPEEFGERTNSHQGIWGSLNFKSATKIPAPKNENELGIKFQRLMLAGLMAPYARAGQPSTILQQQNQSLLHQAAGLIQQQGELSSLDRLNLYRKQMRIRFHDSLEEDFFYLAKYVNSSPNDKTDSEPFTRLMDEYLAEFPANSHSLWDLGSQLPKFLVKYYPKDQTAIQLAKLDLLLLKFALTSSNLNQVSLDASQFENQDSTPQFSFDDHIGLLNLSAKAMQTVDSLKVRDGLSGVQLENTDTLDFASPVILSDTLNENRDIELFYYPADFSALLPSVAQGGTLDDILSRCNHLPTDEHLQIAFSVWQKNKWLVQSF